MPYVDTDFFLALFKEKDWLKPNASLLAKKYQNNLWTSLTTAIELFMLSEEYNLDINRVARDLIQMTIIKGVDAKTVFVATQYIEEGMTVFDAFHAAFCGSDEMISSDKKFDKFGISRIQLERY